MAKCLNCIVLVLGIWMVVSPIALGALMPGLVVDIAAGLLVVVAAAGSMGMKTYKAGLDYLALCVGVMWAFWGIAAVFLPLGSAPVNCVIVGVLVAVVSFLATRFAVTYQGASFYDRGGAPMVDVNQLRMKDGTILMKAMLLQSMPSTVYVKPDEVWKVLTMVPFDLIKALPGFLMRGYRECREQNAEKDKAVDTLAS